MYRTVEERLQQLEQTIEKQAFHIELLQSALNMHTNKLFHLIMTSNMQKHTFESLKQMTKIFEQRVEQGEQVMLSEFMTAFEQILQRDGCYVSFHLLADLIPTWLDAAHNGFSPLLHSTFYR